MVMKRITAERMKEIDRKAQELYAIPGIILMENAGIQAAHQAVMMLENKPKKVCIFCGKGNNGGDGFVVARHLFNRNFKIKVLLIGRVNEIKRDAKINLDILLKMGVEVYELTGTFSRVFVKDALTHTSLIVDAIFGIGLKGTMPDNISEIINMINISKKPVLSIDIPSGLDSNTGRILGGCVKAARTITFGLPKKGFFRNKGPLHTGKISVVDISLPLVLLK
ncbi:MAG: NAD(P)H-hydrate epimerase [Candidatus Omnitrophota bacterium]